MDMVSTRGDVPCCLAAREMRKTKLIRKFTVSSWRSVVMACRVAGVSVDVFSGVSLSLSLTSSLACLSLLSPQMLHQHQHKLQLQHQLQHLGAFGGVAGLFAQLQHQHQHQHQQQQVQQMLQGNVPTALTGGFSGLSPPRMQRERETGRRGPFRRETGR